MNNDIVTIILILIGIAFLIFVIKRVKFLKLGSFVLITGGLKSGKTQLAVYLALKDYRKKHRRWLLKKSILHKVEEEPLLYSNIPLNVPYVPLNEELLLRKKRFNFKSTILLSEASLVADSQLIKDSEINNQLLLWVKLIAHETHCGKLFVESQSVDDLHYSFRRSISNYIFIKSNLNLGLFHALDVREMVYSNVGNVTNVFDNDLDNEDKKRVFIPFTIHNKYDSCCYSVLTDKLDSITKTINGRKLKNLKANRLFSFRKEFNWENR